MIINKNKMEIKYHSLNKENILKEFDVDESKGIYNRDIGIRTNKYGKNILEIEKDYSFIELYFIQVKSFLNILLIFLIIFAFSIWFTSSEEEYLIDSIIITIIFLINTIIGAYQNYNSRKIAKTLSSMLVNKVIVIRDSNEIEINASELVCGDIILLKGGNKIPADCYILESNNLKIDESILTGESKYVNKKSDKLREDIEITSMTNMIFMNTFVISGDVKAIVVKTGMQTEMGKIAGHLNTRKKKTSFLDEIDDVSKTISQFAIVLISIVSIVLLIKGFEVTQVLLIASALIIGSIPEGLPAIVVFLLSRSIHSLAKNDILVKDMGLLETLGGVNILCTDKTGTLTTNKMSVKKIYTNFKISEDINSIDDASCDVIAKIISLANEIEFTDGKIEGEPEDIALINFLENTSYNINEIRSKNKIETLEPFSSETKFISATIKDGITYTKGAYEVIIKNCDYILKDGVIKKIVQSDIDLLDLRVNDFMSEALRIIAFSYETRGKKVFVGFAGLYDKPKTGIKETIESLYSSGIDIKMITGDNKNTAIAIAKECGFKNPKGVEWSEIKDLPEDQLKKKILECNVFARVMPEFKEKIVEILQKEGNRVAITGDGVNDTIALRNADVGIVMGSGSDIAKESSDLILINNDFTKLPLAIKEGRGIFHNIKKVINYLLTANLAEVIVVFIACFLGIIPFTAIQILWVNFVTDIFPALSLGMDPYPENIMKQKPYGKNENLLNLRVKLLIVFISLKKVLMIFVFYYLAYIFALQGGYDDDYAAIFAQTIAFTWLVLTHFVRIAAIRFDEKMSLFTNKFVVISIMAVLIIQLLIIYTPFLRYLFAIFYVPFGFWSFIFFGILIDTISAILITKLIKYLIAKYSKEVENY